MCCGVIVRFAGFFITIVVCVACKDEPVAQLLDSRSDKPEVVQFNGLFYKLIGREVGNRDKNNIAGYTKAALNKQEYAEQIDNILQSEQFYEEGFWHFHEDRLLLGREVAYAEESDRAALRREMADIARADNYWDIFTYRDRWLSLSDLKLKKCKEYINTEGDASSPNARNRCAHYLQAVMRPEVEHEDICISYQEEDEGILTQKEKARKFTDIYRDRCCASEGVASQDTDMCNKINNGYTNLFSEDFCAAAEKTVIDSHCDVNNDDSGMEDEPILSSGGGSDDDLKEQNYPSQRVIWNDSQFKEALTLYISLHLAEDTDLFIDVSVPQGNIYHSDSKTSESFIKATFPENLQGIHASPYWLSTHYTSDSNQHLHRARIIYHSWFCERITPNQAKQEGGDPSDNEKKRFEGYFPTGDAHKNSSKNCFDCHTMIQPLANYFGRMSVGVRYENDRLSTMNAEHFLQGESEEDDKKLPLRADIGTGYFNIHKDKFFEWGHNKPGMVGLGELLSSLPKVKRCVVKYTWNKIFGCENELSQKEISEAVPYLTSYRSLLTHLLMTEKAKAYFIPEKGNAQWNGERVLREMIAEEREARRWQCAHEKTEEEKNTKLLEEMFVEEYDNHLSSGEGIVTSICARCHNDDKKFINTDDSGNITFKNDVTAEMLQTIYLRTNSEKLGGMMPSGGYTAIEAVDNVLASEIASDDPEYLKEIKARGTNSQEIQRNIFKCFIENKAKVRGIKLPELQSCATIDHKKKHETMEQP